MRLIFWVAALKILQNLWENLSNQFFLPFFPGPCGLFSERQRFMFLFQKRQRFFLSIILGEKVVSRKNEA